MKLNEHESAEAREVVRTLKALEAVGTCKPKSLCSSELLKNAITTCKTTRKVANARVAVGA